MAAVNSRVSRGLTFFAPTIVGAIGIFILISMMYSGWRIWQQRQSVAQKAAHEELSQQRIRWIQLAALVNAFSEIHDDLNAEQRQKDLNEEALQFVIKNLSEYSVQTVADDAAARLLQDIFAQDRLTLEQVQQWQALAASDRIAQSAEVSESIQSLLGMYSSEIRDLERRFLQPELPNP